MDVDEVRACLRALLSSSAFSYSLKALLNDFRNMTGFDLPLFGCVHPVEFLRTLSDTVVLIGDTYNPEVALVESKKSAHITSLVERQRINNSRSKCPALLFKQKRLIVTDRSKKENMCLVSDLPPHRNFRENMTSQQNVFRFGNSLQSPKESCPKNALHSLASDSNALRQQNFTEPVSVKNDATVPAKTEIILNGKSNSIPSQEFTGAEVVNVEKPLDASEEETDSCYFEDVSYNERCFNNEKSSNNSHSHVNEGMKKKFKKLIKNYPDGLWCCELPQLFLEEFKYVLDYREFGYTSLIQMLSELSDVFRCVRPGNGDWILFDASVPPTAIEKKMKGLESATAINCEIKNNLRKLLLNCFENESGIELDKIADLYQEMHGSSLDFQSLGFKDLKSLLETWEDDFLNIVNRDGKTVIVQVMKKSPSPIPWEEAIPPITAENDIFTEIFPKDFVGPDESLVELDLMRYVTVGNVVEVNIAEVWSPQKFYLQLNKFKRRLNVFMDDLQNFYNVYLHKYKMPDSTIRPNQVCVGLYNSDSDIPAEWHRAQVVKVINEKSVLINFVDYGTLARVKKTQLRFLHRSFKSFPIQAFLAQLSGIVPPNNETKWPMSTSKRFLELTRVHYLKAEIMDIDFKIPRMSVTLFDPFQKSEISINEKLVHEKLALVREPLYDDPFPEEVMETKLENFKNTEEQQKVLNGMTSDVSKQENLTKNLPELRDEFSDIADLGHTTLFHFKMKSLKLEDSAPVEKRIEGSGPLISSSVSFEFEEVPDLKKNEKKEVLEKASERNKTDKEVAKSDVFENEENPPVLKGLSLIQQSRRSPKHQQVEKQPTQPRAATSEQTSSSISGKPNRLPPGLEHVNVLPNFNQAQFYFQPQDYKKMVNILAMELLTTKPSIKQVGLNNPALALEIATEMAEAYIASQYPGRMAYNFHPLPIHPFTDPLLPPEQLQRNVFEAKESQVPDVFSVSPLAQKPAETTTILNDRKDFVAPEEGKPQISSSKGEKRNEYVKVKRIGGKNLHLVTIDGQMYFGAEEIVRNFTLISSREIADRVLHLKKFNVNYRIITKNTDGEALSAIKSSDLPLFKGKSKKLKIYLIPLAEVVPLLQTLGCLTKTFENDFLELQLKEKEKTNARK